MCNQVRPHALRLSKFVERVFKPPFHAQENNCESICAWTNRDPWLTKATYLSTVSSPILSTQNNGVEDRSLCFAFSVNTWFTSHLDGPWNRTDLVNPRDAASRIVRQSCNLTHLVLHYVVMGFTNIYSKV